jgi:nucleoside triphosphatase
MTNTQFPRGIEVITGTIIRNQKGEILLITNAKWNGKWIIPGGHVEPSETIMDSAQREILEETGLQVIPIGVMDFQEVINPPTFHRPAHFIAFHCIFETTEDTTLNPDPREVSAYKWVTPEDALHEDLTPSIETVIKNYIAYIKK